MFRLWPAQAGPTPSAVSSSGLVIRLPNLPYQAHSFNDADTWTQMLAKGVRWFKIDIGICMKEACESFTTFEGVVGRGTLAECAGPAANPYCCLGLRGDTSSIPDLKSPSNTSWDMVKFFDDDANQALFAYIRDKRERVMWGLAWTGAGSLTDAAASLIRTFLLALKEVILRRDLPVTVYFDSGLNSWWLAIDRQCFDGQCDDNDQSFAESFPVSEWPSEQPLPIANGTMDPLNRVQLLNMDVGLLASECSNVVNGVHHPTDDWTAAASKVSRYPYLWWSVSTQREFLSLVETWSACPVVPPSKRDPHTHMVAACNQGPEMFEVLASTALNRGLNDPFTLDDSLTSPRMVLVPTLSPRSGWDAFAVVALAPRSITSTSAGMVLVVGIINGEPASINRNVVFKLALPVGFNQAVALTKAIIASASSDTVQERLFVASASGQLCVLLFDKAHGRLSMERNLQLSTSLLRKGKDVLVGLGAVCITSNSSSCVVLAAIDQQSPGGSTTIHVLSVRLADPKSDASAAAVSVLASHTVQSSFVINAGASLTVIADVDQPSRLHTSASYSGLFLYSRRSPLPLRTDVAPADESDLIVVDAGTAAAKRIEREFDAQVVAAAAPAPSAAVSSSSADPMQAMPDLALDTDRRAVVYGAYLALTVSTLGSALTASLTMEADGAAPGPGIVPRRLGFGSAPEVSLIQLDGATLALVAMNDGSCDSGLFINNANTAKCEIFKESRDGDTSYNLFQSVPWLLTYSYGHLSRWRDVINGVPSSINDRLISTCNRHIMHGKLESGASITASLFLQNVSYPAGTSGASATGAANSLSAPRSPSSSSSSPSSTNTAYTPPRLEVGVLALHDGAIPTRQHLLTALFCGSPDAKRYLVWDQWHLPQPDVLDAL